MQRTNKGQGRTEFLNSFGFCPSKIREDKNMTFFNRHRVLYAEDNEDSCFMVSVMCELSGIEAVTAKTVAEAWQRSQTECFDLYLLDSQFPDGDGLELCRRLRAYAPQTPILIYSGNAFEIDKQNGLAAGANGYLTKPYMADLAVTIERTIEQTQKKGAGNRNNYCLNIVENDETRRFLIPQFPSTPS